MKKLFFIMLLSCVSAAIFAGGLVTNTNQSAMFTRFQCRDATIDIDAAFYNPAGLVHMSSGFYLSVNNQTIGQLMLVTNDYQNFGDKPKEYRGKVLAPLFPSLFAIYRTGKFAFSAALTPVGGDGRTNFEEGLPSYEREIADAIPSMKTNLNEIDQSLTAVTSDPLYRNITGYTFDMEMNTHSMSLGYQLNASYFINKYLSVAAGVRLVDTRRSISGGISNVRVQVSTSTTNYSLRPSDYLRLVATNATDMVDTLNMEKILDEADLMDAREAMEVDIERRGIGFTPVLSINYSRSLRTNWSLKYEFKTRMDLSTKIIGGKDGNGRYIDGSIYSADIPAMLSVGVTRRPYNKFMYYSGIHYYFDKALDIKDITGLSIDAIDNNSYEFAIGGEYKLNDEIRVSAGWLITRPGVNSNYQSESRFSLASNTFGTGLGLRISNLIDFNIGASYTLYKKDSKDLTYTPEGADNSVTVNEYYDTRKWIFSAGIDFLFGENH